VRGGLVALAFLLGTLVPAGPASADDAQLATGELLFNAGGCTNCHTAKGGEVLAGGDPLKTPFGTFHPPNITPDPETGIGGWSLADFTLAMRDGRTPHLGPLYPAFPYTSYTLMSDADIAALKAYLDTIKPVRKASPDNELRFPFNIRWGLYAWQALFFEPERFVPDPSKGDVWNRGAYLVNGPGHCQQCHTPRNWLGALDESRAFTGADLGKEFGGKVPDITSDPKKGIGDWTEDDIVTLLSLGMTPKGDFVGGEMGDVVDKQTGKLPKEDVRAIAVYLKSIPPG
jgi:mono/diheme cytochrome c family protein